MEAEILHIEASSEFDAVAAENQNIKQLLEETRKAEKEAMENHKRLFERAKMLAKKCEEVSRKRSAEEAEVQEQFAGIGTMEDLDAEIESVVSRLELMTDGNPHAIKEFEKRAETIANTEAKLEDLNGRLEEVQDSISQLRELWEPQIDALVERISEGFSKNFEKINCAGQVQIDKHEDFDQWSIEILVRFR
jgi:chromosome segregation ATPase